MPTPIDPPVDWRTEPAGKRFDTVIAAQLGYTDLYFSGLTGFLWGTKDGELSRLPEYSTDADAALYYLFEKLPDDCVPRLTREQNPMGDHIEYVWGAHIITFEGLIFKREFGEEAATPALAICLAWLSYTEAEENANEPRRD
jgi:hypothetical protein